MINKEELRDIVFYKDGKLFWKFIKVKNQRKVGDLVGFNDNGYMRTKINCKSYLIHRLVWIYHFGNDIQNKIIDHINGNALDNRIENLRIATNQENCFNQKTSKNNNLGVKGVRIMKRNTIKKYQARICINGISKSLGYFQSIEEAHEAYVKASNELYKEFSVFNR